MDIVVNNNLNTRNGLTEFGRGTGGGRLGEVYSMLALSKRVPVRLTDWPVVGGGFLWWGTSSTSRGTISIEESCCFFRRLAPPPPPPPLIVEGG